MLCFHKQKSSETEVLSALLAHRKEKHELLTVALHFVCACVRLFLELLSVYVSL